MPSQRLAKRNIMTEIKIHNPSDMLRSFLEIRWQKSTWNDPKHAAQIGRLDASPTAGSTRGYGRNDPWWTEKLAKVGNSMYRLFTMGHTQSLVQNSRMNQWIKVVARGCWSTVLYFSVISLCSRVVHNGSLFIKGHPSSRSGDSLQPGLRIGGFGTLNLWIEHRA